MTTDRFNHPLYRVTRRFISGNLAGLTFTETTPVSMEVGRTYTPCAGSSAYIITECVAL